MIYRFRVILDNDTDNDVFRDIEIRETDTMEDLHNSITQSFGFNGTEIASFFISNDNWEQGEEISMFDMNENPSTSKLMNSTIIKDIVHEASPKLIYVYDFLNLWTFFVELAEIVEAQVGSDYPNLMFAHGQIPDKAPNKQFESLTETQDSLDLDLDVNDYDNLDFEENWN